MKQAGIILWIMMHLHSFLASQQLIELQLHVHEVNK